MKEWTPGQSDAVGGNPIALRPETFGRVIAATQYVEKMVRLLPPTLRRGRTTTPSSGVWGYVRPGDTISAGNGAILGFGNVTLCSRDDANLTADGDVVEVYNSGPAVSGGVFIPLLWMDGVWSPIYGSGTAYGNCECSNPPYVVYVNCGNCAAYYSGGAAMPKYYYLSIQSAAPDTYSYDGYQGTYADPCLIPCGQLSSYTVKLTHKGDDGTGGAYSTSCTWSGWGGACLGAELTLNGSNWQLTVYDKNGCILLMARKSASSFNCCGSNSGWTIDPSSVCTASLSLTPDPCTCCPEPYPVCPPAGGSPCDTADCCITNCSLWVTVNGLYTFGDEPCTYGQADCYAPDGSPCQPGEVDCKTPPPPPPQACGGMNGAFYPTWVGNCTWRYYGKPGGGGGDTVSVEVTLNGNTWTVSLLGPLGQTAVFMGGPANCGVDAFTLSYVSGSCPTSGGTPSATLSFISS